MRPKSCVWEGSFGLLAAVTAVSCAGQILESCRQPRKHMLGRLFGGAALDSSVSGHSLVPSMLSHFNTIFWAHGKGIPVAVSET